ncbi:Nsp1-like C-terminal region-domain-containing protein [Pisolithus orientalis]|uniref:Nsp1-like C-terminal region-domain-containing protein n=1 Tax=Pisolithus orientalis TaxID=936130 RepID=UPI0022249B44|nr:Nsp1-like C-terminal region-domain-containing protein [Pisolithus orientalis]KAI6035260.1 Nsp1-like C-terminal region-domain-containing protein [Pisolithus orientalis]
MSAPQQNNQPSPFGSGIFGTTAGNAGTGTSSTAPSFSLNTGGSSPGLFGNTGSGASFFSNPTSSGGLFGKPTTPTTGAPSTSAPGTVPSLFGGTTTSTLPTSTSSIFGKAASPAPGVPSSTAPGASVAGAATGTTPTTTAISSAGSSFFSTPPASSVQSIFGNLGGTGAPAPATSKPTSFVPLTPNATAAPTAASTASFLASATTQGKDGTSTTVPPAAPTGGLFGAVPPKGDSTEKKDAPRAASPFGLFGSKDKAAPSEKTDAAAPAAGLFGGKLGAATGGGATTVTASTLAPKDGDKAKDAASPSTTIAVAPPSVLKGKTIEEIVNKWSSELENQVREFNKFAAEVAVWDRALMENGNNLAALYSHVVAVEREQTEIEQTLDHIEQQQRDLSVTLDAYERSTEEILGSQGGSLRSLDTGPADTERDKNYSTSLTQMIDSVNTLSLSATNSVSPHSGDDPLMQISQILNSHLESLQWIDGAVREVEGKLTQVERRVRDAGLGNSLGNGLARQRGFGLPR